MAEPSSVMGSGKSWRMGDNDSPSWRAKLALVLLLVVPVFYAVGWFISCDNPYQWAEPTAESYARSFCYQPSSSQGEIIEQPDAVGRCTLRIGLIDHGKTVNNRIEITLRRHFMFGGWTVTEHTFGHIER